MAILHTNGIQAISNGTMDCNSGATGVTYDPPSGISTTTFYYREATGKKTNGPLAGQYTCIVNSNLFL
jgi:hypothetical protein